MVELIGEAQDDKNSIVVDVTVSGRPIEAYKLPNGNIHNFTDKNGKTYSVWKNNDKPYSFKLNAAQIEYFQSQTYSIVDVKCKRKPISRLKEWWYNGWNDFKIWDVEILKTNEKTITMVKTVSGQIMYLDNDESIFENAINSQTE